MGNRFRQFMYGRYGVDSYGKFLIGCGMACCVLNMFMHSRLLSMLMWILIIYAYMRMLTRQSDKIRKRYEENQKYLQAKNKFLTFWKREKSNMQQRKTHHIYRCPTCKQKIRIPRGKGRICITCPKCKTEFTKTS